MWLKIKRRKCDLEAIGETTQELTGESSKWFNLLGVTLGRVFQEARLLGRVITRRPLQWSKCQPVKPECLSRKDKVGGEEVPTVFPQLKVNCTKGAITFL